MKSFIVLALVCLIVVIANGASLNVRKPQDPSPTSNITVNATVHYVPEGMVTNFSLVVQNLRANQWTAVGFSQNHSMGESHVFMCKRFTNDTVILKRYINPYHHRYPLPAGTEQGGELTILQQKLADGVTTCLFSLSNFKTMLTSVGEIKPLTQTGSYNPIVAVGILDDDDEPNYHEDTRTILEGTVRLNQHHQLIYNTGNGSSIITLNEF